MCVCAERGEELLVGERRAVVGVCVQKEGRSCLLGCGWSVCAERGEELLVGERRGSGVCMLVGERSGSGVCVYAERGEELLVGERRGSGPCVYACW